MSVRTFVALRDIWKTLPAFQELMSVEIAIDGNEQAKA